MDSQSNNSRKTVQRLSKAPVAGNDFGRIPPQALDLEQAVLGAMMLERNAVTDAIDILQKESFYDPKHQYIYGVIKELFGRSKPIDLLTVTEQLKKNGELEAAG